MPNVKHSLISLLACAVFVSSVLGACAKKPAPEPETSEPESSVSEEISEPEVVEPEISEPEPEPEISEPESSEESESSEEESSEPEEPKNNPFAISAESVTDMYIYNPNALVYTPLRVNPDSASADDNKSPVIEVINALPKLSTYDYDKSARYSTGFLIYDKNGARHEYNIMSGALIANGTGYYLPKENYEQIMDLAAQYMQSSGSAQWLLRISPARVSGVECTDENGSSFSVKQENLRSAAQKLRGLTVSGGKAFQQGSYEFAGMDGLQIKITFDTGVTFSVLIDSSYLYIESSDMSFGCRYNIDGNTIQSFAATMKKLA